MVSLFPCFARGGKVIAVLVWYKPPTCCTRVAQQPSSARCYAHSPRGMTNLRSARGACLSTSLERSTSRSRCAAHTHSHGEARQCRPTSGPLVQPRVAAAEGCCPAPLLGTSVPAASVGAAHSRSRGRNGGWLVPLALANALSAHDDVLEMTKSKYIRHHTQLPQTCT